MGIPVLSITDPAVLGKMMVESAIYFEASAAELIGAEGAKLQILNAAAENGAISAEDLATANEAITNMVCCLKDLENAILAKINAGLDLINNGF